MSAPVTPSASGRRDPRRRRASGPVVPHQPRWYQRLAAWLVVALVRTVAATLRYRWRDESGYLNQPNVGPAIYCTWHNRLALSMKAYHSYVHVRNAAPGMAAMVSASKDGGFLAAILEGFDVQPVRGSSSRRGPQALLELTTWAGRGYDLAITPDGPRGPCYQIQEGVMSLAQVTGLPIIPFSYNARWTLRVKSWDRFVIPLPFSRCEMILGKAMPVPREISDEKREEQRLELERTMREMVQNEPSGIRIG